MGVMERVRLEHVLGDAGVPTEEGAFVAWVDGDPDRLRRLLSATLAKSPAERELVGGGFTRWKAGLPRAAKRSGALGLGGSTAWSKVASPEVPSESVRSRGLGWLVPLMMLVVLVGGGTWLTVTMGVGDGQHAVSSSAEEGGDTDGQMFGHGTGGAEADDLGGEAPSTQDLGERNPSVDLTRVEVAVPWPVLVASPRAWVEPPAVPWSSWVVGVVSMVVFVVAWRGTRRRRLLPAPAARPTRPGAGRVQPDLDRGGLPAFVERSQQETLIWGIGREVSDRTTDQLDAERTVGETIARGGLPQLWFQPAFEHRGVWLWRDRRMKSGQADAKRLEAEIVRTLKEAELPVHVATFARVPDSLQKVDGPTFSPQELDEQRRTTRVVVLTDGHGLLQARTARSQAEVRELLRRLQGWHALAVVVFGERVDEVERLLEPYGIACLRPPDAVAHLAGALREGGAVERERELLRWETACALAPRRIREADALALRNGLELRIEGFAVEALRRRHGRGQHLVWSPAKRVAILADYDRAFGYRAMGWDAVESRTLIGRALAFWREYYEQALADAELDPATRDLLKVELLILGLWDRPEEVVRGHDGEEGLFALFQTEALEPAVRELVAQYTDVDGEPERVRLPWRYDERAVDVQVMLGRMGFSVRHPVARVQRAGRWGWGLGLALGVGAASLGRGAMEMMMPVEPVEMEPTVKWVGPQVSEDERWGACESDGHGWSTCRVASRFSHGEQAVQVDRVVEARWDVVRVPCEEQRELEVEEQVIPVRLLRCTSQGRLPRRPQGRPAFSTVVLMPSHVESGTDRLARALLDTGSADWVMILGIGSTSIGHFDLPREYLPEIGPPSQRQHLRIFDGVRIESTSTGRPWGMALTGFSAMADALEQLDGVATVNDVWPGTMRNDDSFVLVGAGREEAR